MSACRRNLILLLGLPRSGTSWLAKILDTSPEVQYLHEPMKKIKAPWLQATVQGQGNEISHTISAALRRLDPTWLRLPFFPKNFLRFPPWALTCLWGMRRFLSDRLSPLRCCFTPRSGHPYDLLVKEVDWLGKKQHLVECLRPDHLIVLFRHPCAVVNSRLEGLRLGKMESFREGWIEHNVDRCAARGFTPERVAAMEMDEFFALHWLLSSLELLERAQAHGRATRVIYEELCQEPEHTASLLFRALGWQPTSLTGRFIRASTSPGVPNFFTKVLRGKSAYYGIQKDSAIVSTLWRKKLTPTQQRRIRTIAESFPHMDWWTSEKHHDASWQSLPPVHI